MGERNKLLIEIGGEPLVRRTAKVYLAAGIDVHAVLGYEAAGVRAALQDLPISFVANPRYEEGQQTSVRAGVVNLTGAYDAILVVLTLACGCLFFAGAGFFWIANKHHNWITTSTLILSLWFIRFAWLELNIPATLIGGWLFNPNLYASPFIFGLSSSLGELILTVITVIVSAWVFLYRTIIKSETSELISRISLRAGRIWSIAFVCIISMLILWLFRGFGEAIRSFVFDSTIRYGNPSEILPEADEALMYFNIILLGTSLLCVSTALLYIGKRLISIFFYVDDSKSRIIFIGSVIICIPIFALTDGTQFSPLLSSIAFIAISIILVELIFNWKSSGFDSSSWQWKFVLWITLGSFVIGAPLLHQELQQRERKEVEDIENEILLPSDSWLTNV